MISKEVVEKVAKLSRLNLDENEITLYARSTQSDFRHHGRFAAD